jgi:hypothetical protein
MAVLTFIIAFCAFFPSHSGAADGLHEGNFGAYMHHNLSLVHSPVAFKSALSNGNYNFEIGWIEPNLPLFKHILCYFQC